MDIDGDQDAGSTTCRVKGRRQRTQRRRKVQGNHFSIRRALVIVTAIVLMLVSVQAADPVVAQTPAANGNQQAGNGNQQAGNGNQPTGNGNQQAGNGNQQQAGNGNQPAGNGNQQAGNGNQQTGNGNQPAGNGNQPAPTGAPNGQGPVPGGQTAGSSSTLSSIPSSVPNGGITITQPQQTAAQSYYKIAQGSNVTFAWNFTDVLRYPTSLVVAAYCSDNANTYTIASSLPGTATSLVWSPFDYDASAARIGAPQLIQATYRLQITDERGLSVAAQPGLFTPNSKVTFALYQPRPYIPISEGWTCASCNSGAHLHIPSPGNLLLMTAVVAMASLYLLDFL